MDNLDKMDNKEINDELLKTIDAEPHAFNDKSRARLTIHGNKVVDSNLIDGLLVDAEERKDGVSVKLVLQEGVRLENPVHLCFGMLAKTGLQRIDMDVLVQKNAKISLYAHCTFPVAVDVKHLMNATIKLEEGADYAYFERHVHSEDGGVTVVPRAKVFVGKNSRFKTEFELLKGRVGKMDIEYETFVDAYGLVDMTARVNGHADDYIKLNEMSELNGEYAKAVLTSKIAVRDKAVAEIYNKITAKAPHSRGHVDCKEIVTDNGRATAIPVVDVRDSSAHVTHEAAVGSVDKKQLETLMARGLDEDEASELIIQGLLS